MGRGGLLSIVNHYGQNKNGLSTRRPSFWIIAKESFPFNYALYLQFCGITPKPWQFNDTVKMMGSPRFILNWGRGMSKTFLGCYVVVFCGLFGLNSCYIVPRTDQLVTAMDYFDGNPFVDRNPYKKGKDKSWTRQKTRFYMINGRFAVKLIQMDDNGENVSSGRYDIVIRDESAQLMNKSREDFLIEKSNGLLSASKFPHEWDLSTPLIGSRFVNMMNDLKMIAPELVSWRNFQNTPDNFVSNTPEKLDYLMQSLEKNRRLGTEWFWRCEHLALPETPGGHPFPNVRWSEHIYRKPSHIGFDFHGHTIGHIGVEMYWNPDTPLKLYAVRETQHKYEKKSTAAKSVEFIGTPYYRGISKAVETYGFNEGYYRDAQIYGVRPINIAGNKKHSAAYNLLQYEFFINEKLTPNLAKDIINARWEDPNIFKLFKKSSGNTYRNHYIDACLNGQPMHNIGDGVYGKGPQPKLKDRVATEHQRDVIAQRAGSTFY